MAVDDPKDPVYGILSYVNQTPFEIGEDVWPSIHRYVLASRFEGSPLFSKIREAASDALAMMLSRPCVTQQLSAIGIKTVRLYRYNSKPVPTIDLRKVLTAAITAKLPRMREVLMSTYPATLTSKLLPAYAHVLTTIRNDAATSAILTSLEPKLNLVDDLPPLVAEGLEERVPKVIKKYAKALSLAEGAARPEIRHAVDAIANIIPQKCVELEARIRWDHIARHTPRYHRLIRTIREDFTLTYFRDPETDSISEINRVSLLAAATVRWAILDPPDDLERKLSLSPDKLKATTAPATKGPPRPPLEERVRQYAVTFGEDPKYHELVATAEGLVETDRVAFLATHALTSTPKAKVPDSSPEEGGVVVELLEPEAPKPDAKLEPTKSGKSEVKSKSVDSKSEKSEVKSKSVDSKSEKSEVKSDQSTSGKSGSGKSGEKSGSEAKSSSSDSASEDIGEDSDEDDDEEELDSDDEDEIDSDDSDEDE